MSMPDNEPIIPPPPVVRDRLARSLRETRLLRRLLRLSVAAAQEQASPTASEPRQTAPRREGELWVALDFTGPPWPILAPLASPSGTNPRPQCPGWPIAWTK